MLHVSHRQTDIDITKSGNGAAGKDITWIEKKRRSAERKPTERLTEKAVWDWQCCNHSGMFTPVCVHMCIPCFEPYWNYTVSNLKITFSCWLMYVPFFFKSISKLSYVCELQHKGKVWLMLRIQQQRSLCFRSEKTITVQMAAGVFQVKQTQDRGIVLTRGLV